jgi:tetratricopeptide (TPR) repeat protein
VLMSEAHYAAAIPHYTRGIELGFDGEFVRLMKSLALVRLQRYAESKAELEQGVAAFPESTSLRTALARLLAACPDPSLRDPERALRLTEKLVKSCSDLDFEVVEAYAMALAAAGRFSDAAQLQKQMIAEVRGANREDLVAPLEQNLVLYENRKTCPVPWRGDDPIFVPRPGKITLLAPEMGDLPDNVNSRTE